MKFRRVNLFLSGFFCPLPSIFPLLHSLKITANMISEDLVKQRFVHDTISQGINLIYQTQENVVRTYLNTRSGQACSVGRSLSRSPKANKSTLSVFFRISVILIFDIDGETTEYHAISGATWLCIIELYGEFFIMRLSLNCVMVTMKPLEIRFVSN